METTTSWGQGLGKIPSRLKQRAFKTVDKDALLAADAGETGLKKVLKTLDVVMVGIGIILGSGVYVTTGSVANGTSGPAVVLAYVVAGVSAMLTGLCYAEFAVDFPVSGGSYTYVLSTFGELMAWFTVGMMVIQYMLANAGVARGFSGYFANLFGQETDFFMIAGRIDICAFVIVGGFTCLLVFGTKESALFNNVCNVLAVSCVVLVIVVGFMNGSTANLTPFFGEFGWRGVFNGAAIVFFSYIGFDAICNCAEEAINPTRDVPIGLVTSLSVVTVLYVLAALAISMMLPYTQINPDAAFSDAFKVIGVGWASYVVAAGACVAITTGVLVGVMTVPRLVSAAAREGLIPKVFESVHPKFGTPYIATIATGGITAIIALFTSLDVLLDLTSICVLTVYAIIAAAATWRRYYAPGEMSKKETTLLAVHFTGIIVISILFGSSFVYFASIIPFIVCFVVWIGITLSMQISCQPKYLAAGFKVPLMPWLGSFSMLANLFLLCTVPLYAFGMWAVFIAILILTYLLYGLNGAANSEIARGLKPLDEEDAEGEQLTKEVEVI